MTDLADNSQLPSLCGVTPSQVGTTYQGSTQHPTPARAHLRSDSLAQGMYSKTGPILLMQFVSQSFPHRIRWKLTSSPRDWAHVSPTLSCFLRDRPLCPSSQNTRARIPVVASAASGQGSWPNPFPGCTLQKFLHHSCIYSSLSRTIFESVYQGL